MQMSEEEFKAIVKLMDRKCNLGRGGYNSNNAGFEAAARAILCRPAEPVPSGVVEASEPAPVTDEEVEAFCREVFVMFDDQSKGAIRAALEAFVAGRAGK